MGVAYTNQTLLLGLQLGPEFLDLAFGTALPLLRGRQLFRRTHSGLLKREFLLLQLRAQRRRLLLQLVGVATRVWAWRKGVGGW